MKVVDFYTDKDKRVWKQITKIADAERNLLDRRALLDADVDSMADSAFADPENRLFPVFSKEAAYVSYFYAKIQNLEKIASLIESVLSDIYNISVPKDIKKEEVDDIFDLHKEASLYQEEDFYRGRYRKYSDKVASSIKKMDLNKTASMDNNLFKVHMDLRKTLCDRSGVPRAISAGYEKIAEYFIHNPHVDKVETFLKVADVISTIDKKAGINTRYDKDIPNPVDVVSSSLVLAEDYLNGVKYPLSKLVTVPINVYTALLGEEFSSKIVKNGKINKDMLKAALLSLDKARVKKLNEGLKVIL